MPTNKKKTTNKKEPEVEAEDWDLSEGMGILPSDIPLTQNIGCVGGNSKKPDSSNQKSTK